MTTINENTVLELLKNELPSTCFIEVIKRQNYFSKTEYIKIFFAANHIDINNVKGQKPQAVSLSLDLDTLEIQPQVFGGNGGNRVHRKPDLTHPKEQYLAMCGIKVPFRQPQKNDEAILKSIKRFAENWKKTIRENKNVLCYQDLVDYSQF